VVGRGRSVRPEATKATTNDQRRSTNDDQRRTTNDQRPTTNGHRPTDTDHGQRNGLIQAIADEQRLTSSTAPWARCSCQGVFINKCYDELTSAMRRSCSRCTSSTSRRGRRDPGDQHLRREPAETAQLRHRRRAARNQTSGRGHRAEAAGDSVTLPAPSARSHPHRAVRPTSVDEARESSASSRRPLRDGGRPVRAGDLLHMAEIEQGTWPFATSARFPSLPR